MCKTNGALYHYLHLQVHISLRFVHVCDLVSLFSSCHHVSHHEVLLDAEAFLFCYQLDGG